MTKGKVRQVGCLELFKLYLSAFAGTFIFRPVGSHRFSHDSPLLLRLFLAILGGLIVLFSTYNLQFFLIRMVQKRPDMNLSLVAWLDVVLSIVIACFTYFVCWGILRHGHF